VNLWGQVPKDDKGEDEDGESPLTSVDRNDYNYMATLVCYAELKRVLQLEDTGMLSIPNERLQLVEVWST
jgi:hypothetical protein